MQELKILWDENTGQVTVNGQIQNKALCYLMLECARDAIKDHYDRTMSQPQIVPVPAMPTMPNGFIRRTKGNRHGRRG